jgi:hypothetical protein
MELAMIYRSSPPWYSNPGSSGNVNIFFTCGMVQSYPTLLPIFFLNGCSHRLKVLREILHKAASFSRLCGLQMLAVTGHAAMQAADAIRHRPVSARHLFFQWFVPGGCSAARQIQWQVPAPGCGNQAGRYSFLAAG